MTTSKINQEKVFVDSEADAWFMRNQHLLLQPVDPDHYVLQALQAIKLPDGGNFIDLGGGAGKVAAGILKMFPGLSATVLEPSTKAVTAGKVAFPEISFLCGSLSQKQDMPSEQYDLVIVAGVFTLIDRSLLSQAMANVDQLVKDGGHVVISDFYTPYARANTYHHRPGCLTYKQDYAAPLRALNIYTEVYMKAAPLSENTGLLSFDAQDPYDVWWMTSALQKDVTHRYKHPRL